MYHYYCFNFKEGNFGFKKYLHQKFLFAVFKILIQLKNCLWKKDIKILPWMMLQVLLLLKSVVNFWDGDIATADTLLNPTLLSSFWWTWINVSVSQLEFLMIALELKNRWFRLDHWLGWDSIYTAGWYVWGEWFLVINHHNHKNWVPSILIHNLWLILIRMKQKKFFWPTQKKVIFQNRQFSIFFCENLLDWSLG